MDILKKKLRETVENIRKCFYESNETEDESNEMEEGWAHLTCALWLPETYVQDPFEMEPICGLDMIDKRRKKLSCEYCRTNGMNFKVFKNRRRIIRIGKLFATLKSFGNGEVLCLKAFILQHFVLIICFFRQK